MRSSEPALFSLLPPLLSIIKKERPELHVIENGDCDNYEDAGEIRKKAGDGLEGIMIARGAEKNLSCFDKEGIKSNHEVVLPLFLRVVRFRSTLSGSCPCSFHHANLNLAFTGQNDE